MKNLEVYDKCTLCAERLYLLSALVKQRTNIIRDDTDNFGDEVLDLVADEIEEIADKLHGVGVSSPD